MKLNKGEELMCTSITFTTKNHYFGRNLDYEFSYGEEIAILPRNYPLSFRYLGEKKEPGSNLITNNVRFSYIAKPAKVAYLADLGGTNVDCDLPEYLHVDILKHAVDLYRIAVSGQLHSVQQQTQPQQQAQAQQQTQQ